MTCIPCNMLDLLGATVGATVGRAAVAGCPCKSAIALLVRLGAKHAAQDHAQGSLPQTPQDAELHMQEEEKLFFPLLPHSVEQQFLAEHAIFRAELKKYGQIKSTDLYKAHGNRENLWAERILGQEASGVSVTGARVGQTFSVPTINVTQPKFDSLTPDPSLSQPEPPKKSFPWASVAAIGMTIATGLTVFLIGSSINRHIYPA